MYRKAICNKLKKKKRFCLSGRRVEINSHMFIQDPYDSAIELCSLTSPTEKQNFSEFFEGRTQASENSLSLHCFLTSSLFRSGEL